MRSPLLDFYLLRNSSGIPSTPPVAAHKRKREQAGTPRTPPRGLAGPLDPPAQELAILTFSKTCIQ